MNIFHKFLIATLFVVFLTIGLVKYMSVSADAGASPDLGTAENFSVLAKTAIDISVGGSVSSEGNLGISAGDSSSLTGTWNAPNKYFSNTLAPDDLVASNAQADALIAYNNLAGQTSSGVWDWSLSRNPPPGVWDMDADHPYVNSIITLDGDYNDVWIFRFAGDLNLIGSVVMAGNAQPCNVFWVVDNDTSIRITGAVSYYKNFFSPKIAFADDVYKLKGTLISNGPIEFLYAVNVEGRVISLNGSVSTLFSDGIDSFITQPACASAPTIATLTLAKTIINDDEGNARATDWTLSAVGPSQISGENESVAITNAVVDAGTYVLSESDGPSGYTASEYSCKKNSEEDALGNSIILAVGDNAVCTIKNDDVAPVRRTSGGKMNWVDTLTPPVPDLVPAIVPVSKICDLYLLKYIKLGAKNDPIEVRKLQQFLKDYEGYNNLTVDGIYGLLSYGAAKEFQSKYFVDVLSPWSLAKDRPTGWVYQTTTKKINEIYCEIMNRLWGNS